MEQSKEILQVKLQSLFEFIYDSHINKYGLLNVAERKLKEMLFSVTLHRTKSEKIELFARFLGISETCYSADDLDFLFNFSQILLLKYFLAMFSENIQNRISNASHVKSYTAAFELIKEIKLKEILDTIQEYFCERIDTENLNRIKKKMGELYQNNSIYWEKVLTDPKDISEAKLKSEIILQTIVDEYRNLKHQITEILQKRSYFLQQNCQGNYADEFFTLDECYKISKNYNCSNQAVQILFEKCAVNTQDEWGECIKKISLEMIISYMLYSKISLK